MYQVQELTEKYHVQELTKRGLLEALIDEDLGSNDEIERKAAIEYGLTMVKENPELEVSELWSELTAFMEGFEAGRKFNANNQ